MGYRFGLSGLLIIITGLFATAVVSASPSGDYPEHWWKPVPKEGAPSWEVLPQEAGEGEVILSKRTELGLLSNFADTSFLFRAKLYPSLEGFWQMMKYPDGSKDPRATFPGLEWKYTREEVSRMVGFDAKRAGSLASKNMEKMGINWVSFGPQRMTYRTPEKGDHYYLIVEASWAKVVQNPKVKEILLMTGDLILRPDHKQKPDVSPAWKYHEIYMMIRKELQKRGEGAVSGLASGEG